MNTLIDQLNKAIDQEYDAQNEAVATHLKLPLKTRIKRGDTLANLTAYFFEAKIYQQMRALNEKNPNFKEDTAEKQFLHFDEVEIHYKGENLSKFRKGSRVTLSKGNDVFELDLISDNQEGKIRLIRPIGSFSPLFINTTNIGTSGWNLDETAIDIRHVVKKATEVLKNNPNLCKKIEQLLANAPASDPITSSDYLKGLKIAEKTPLNDIQKEAFAQAYAATDYYLIQGPPGTGKTQLLAHLALQWAKEGKNVLVTAATHTAINNAMLKIAQIEPSYPHLIKVGTYLKNEEIEGNTSIQAIEDLSQSKYDPTHSKGMIVGATCYTPHTRRMKYFQWDIILLDEASQLNIPLAVAAMVSGKKYIFIGDHKQLPPILLADPQKALFNHSIFEHLYKKSPSTMLNLTYRMHQAINQFPSDFFYNKQLIAAQENATKTLPINNQFGKYQSVLDTQKPEILALHQHKGEEYHSAYEAQQIAQWIEIYLQKGIQPQDIAIIAPFRMQVNLISKTIAKNKILAPYLPQLFIDTIERIQGQEREVVFLSWAVSSWSNIEKRSAFLFSPNRLNVALTRAKKKRIVIANEMLFQTQKMPTEMQKSTQYFDAFFKNATKIKLI